MSDLVTVCVYDLSINVLKNKYSGKDIFDT
jgi:hypothetical protein